MSELKAIIKASKEEDRQNYLALVHNMGTIDVEDRISYQNQAFLRLVRYMDDVLTLYCDPRTQKV